jgi:PIN domain nuclease of toxin-antitoxin system
VIATILVDTHLVLWARIEPERLTIGERRALDDARSCYISAVSLREIAILMAMDRIARDERLLAVPDGFDLLPVLPDHCKALVAAATASRSVRPMLIAQARAEHLVLLTRDRAIIAYGAAGADVVTFED